MNFPNLSPILVMTKDSKAPEEWSSPIPHPQEPDIEWVSIERLLDEHTIPVLAEAIDSLNIQTIDATGRRILATSGDESDHWSKAYALKLLKFRYSMLQDPRPEDDSFYERLETGDSPLEGFGWPKDQLPNFSEIQLHYQPDNTTELWTQRSAEEFEREFISVSKNFTAAGRLHGVTRQRYTEVIKQKCRASLFERD